MTEPNDSEGNVEKPCKEELEDPSGTVQDAVFGEITEEGPNYRNVSFPSQSCLKILIIPGRLDRNRGPYVKNPVWPWCPLHPPSTQHIRLRSRHHLFVVCCVYGHVGQLCYWCFQEAAS